MVQTSPDSTSCAAKMDSSATTTPDAAEYGTSSHSAIAVVSEKWMAQMVQNNGQHGLCVRKFSLRLSSYVKVTSCN